MEQVVIIRDSDKNGRLVVAKYVKGGLALHKESYPTEGKRIRWVISHTQSGLALCVEITGFKRAKMIMEDFLTLGGWDKDKETVVKDELKKQRYYFWGKNKNKKLDIVLGKEENKS